MLTTMTCNGEVVLELCAAVVLKNGVKALDGLTLAIRAGEHTAILGPNGSGKTTLVNLLTHHDRALARPEGPAPVRVLGAERWDVFDLRSRLGVVSADLHQRFVGGNSTGWIRGADAVLSGFFASHGVHAHLQVTPDMHRRAEAALARVGAAHLARRTLNEMSTGEARRVLIARALVGDPAVLVLDEPTAGLDVVARHQFLHDIAGLAGGGTTLVLVTHHVEEIVPAIGRVILLARGRVAGDGPKRDMLAAAPLSRVFGAPIAIEERGGFYSMTA
jgi:iron complex transport system ATP-binding protein